jgi:sulfite exporter TauE/SafE
LWSASQGNAWHSALLMLAFGLGTWPVLLATGVAAERVTALLRRRSVRVAGGVLVIVFGLWTLPGPHQQWLMGHRHHAMDHTGMAHG